MCLIVSSQFSFGALSKHIVRYELKAKLLTAEKAVAGEEVLTWLNDSETPASELEFHLYLNAFKNNRTTFMRESKGAHRGFKVSKEHWGYIEITKLQTKDGIDILPAMEYIQPDDGNPDDQTVVRVSLPRPVAPHETVTLHIGFFSKLPKIFSRSGFNKNFFMVAQWFPKVGVWQDGKWNCHQYHNTTEFFADYGVYRVEITVPEKYVVGATGLRISEAENPDHTKTFVYYQEDVHDFAWTACPDFVEFREKFVIENPRVETEMILLIHRTHLTHRGRYLQALKNAIEFYSQNYGAYPYPTITLVDPAPGAGGAGGMEYPTLFTGGTWSLLPRGFRMLEMVTIHEFGHGYWYGIVGSNEFEEAWLDEGINTYSEMKAMARYYGREGSMVSLGGIRFSDFDLARLPVIGSGRMDPVLKNSWEFVSSGSYSLNVYYKAALMLLMLERSLGEDLMANIMRTYFERWKFKHPTSRDFIQVAEEVSGQDLDWFFDQALRSPDKLDYALGELRAQEVKKPEGKFDGLKEEKEAPQEKGLEISKNEVSKASPGKLKMYRNEVVVLRKGEWTFPQEILIIFENGEKVQETWDGSGRWKRFVYIRPYKVQSARLDPEGKMVLDVNYTNNSMSLKPEKAAIWKYALGFMTAFQKFLSFISF